MTYLVDIRFLPVQNRPGPARMLNEDVAGLVEPQLMDWYNLSERSRRECAGCDQDSNRRPQACEPANQAGVMCDRLEIIENHERTATFQMLEYPLAATVDRLLLHSVAEKNPGHLAETFVQARFELAIDPNRPAGKLIGREGFGRGLDGQCGLSHSAFALENCHAPLPESRVDRRQQFVATDECRGGRREVAR